MIETVNISRFRAAFVECDRATNFSYEGLSILFEYLDELDPDMELDVIGICCDFNEDTIEDIAEQNSIDIEGLDEDEAATKVRDFLIYNTILVGETETTFVYASF